MAIPAKTRVQQYRTRLRGRHYRRVELWLHDGVWEDLRMVAAYRRIPLRQVVQEAVRDVVTRYDGVLFIIKRSQRPT